MRHVYVIPGITDADAQREHLVAQTISGSNDGVLHHHRLSEGCGEAVKPCEGYYMGKLIEAL